MTARICGWAEVEVITIWVDLLTMLMIWGGHLCDKKNKKKHSIGNICITKHHPILSMFNNGGATVGVGGIVRLGCMVL